jgi:hypothetical protein
MLDSAFDELDDGMDDMFNSAFEELKEVFGTVSDEGGAGAGADGDLLDEEVVRICLQLSYANPYAP